MDFKLVMLSVACFTFFIQPAQSGVILPAAINTFRDIASIGTNVVKTKGAAMVRGATDIGSILATGLGLKLRALAQASAAVKEGGADGLIAIGGSMKKLGDTIVGNKLAGTSAANSASPAVSRNTRILVEAPVVQEVVEDIEVKTPAVVEEVAVPCVEEAVEVPVQSIPIRSVRIRGRRPEAVVEASARLPSVFSLLKNAARSKINGIASIFNVGGSRNIGPVVYEIVDTPRVFPGPVVEAFQVRNK